MEKKYTSFLVAGITSAMLFSTIVFAKLSHTPVSEASAFNEVSPSANLTIDFDNHRHYLFTSSTCPHCANVGAFLASESAAMNDWDLITASVDGNNRHQEQMAAFAKDCGLDTHQGLGIPFLYVNDQSVAASERCQVGDTTIINYLTNIARGDTGWGGRVASDGRTGLIWTTIIGLICAGGAWYYLANRREKNGHSSPAASP